MKQQGKIFFLKKSFKYVLPLGKKFLSNAFNEITFVFSSTAN